MVRRPSIPTRWSLLMQFLTVAVLATTWEVLSQTGVLEPFFYSSPSAIGEALAGWWSSGVLLPSLMTTLVEALVGYALGAVIGLVLGLVLGMSRTAGLIFEPFLAAFNAVPRVTFFPFLIVILGIGISSKIAAAALWSVLLVFFSVFGGMRQISNRLVDHVRLLGAGRLALFRYVYAPATLVWLLIGLRGSLGFAFTAAIVAEYFGSSAGLGFLIFRGQSLLRTQDVFAGLVLSALTVIVIDSVLDRLERVARVRTIGT